MKFTKMHGLGNDYLYVYGDVPENIAELFHYDETVSVLLDGGTLKIQIAPDNTVQMTGPAETVYEGETEIC